VQSAGGEHEHRARGQLLSNDDGSFRFRSILAHCYPIPHDGPVGGMLTALGRHPWRPAHLHFMVNAPGYERLITHVFRKGDRYLDSDAAFAVRSSLVADWVRHESGKGEPSEGTYYTLDYSFVLIQARMSDDPAHRDVEGQRGDAGGACGVHPTGQAQLRKPARVDPWIAASGGRH
jgi:hydroxyquinol 1,2-dioxygenase